MHVMQCLFHTQHKVCICAIANAHDKKLIILCCPTYACMTGSPVSMTAAASEPPPCTAKLTELSVGTSVCSLPAVSQEPAESPQLNQPTHSLPLHTQFAAPSSAAIGWNESSHMPAAQQSAAATSNRWTDRLPQTLPLPWPLWKRSNSPAPTDPTSTTQQEWSSASVSASASSPQHGPGSLSGDVRGACRLSQGLERSASPAAAASSIQGLVHDPCPASQDEEDIELGSHTPAEATTHVRASSADGTDKCAVADCSTEPTSTSEVTTTNRSRSADAAPDVASGSPDQIDAAADAVAHVNADLGVSSVPVRGGKPGKLGAVETQAMTLEQQALLIKGLQLSKQVQQVCCASPEFRANPVSAGLCHDWEHKVCFWFSTIGCQYKLLRHYTCCTTRLLYIMS